MTRWIALMLVLSWGLASPSDAWARPHAGAKGVSVASAPSGEQATKALMRAAVHCRLMIVGEVHGTNETPALVASLVRYAAASERVRLGLEMPSEIEGVLHAYLRSAGGARDKAALLQQPFWSSQDGRSSVAMFELIEAVRALREKGRDADVFAMEPVYPGDAAAAKAGGYLKVKEAGMAAAIRREMEKAVPHQLIIALMGNYHARDSHVAGFKGMPDGSVTERLGAFSPYVIMPFAAHSQSWNCTAEGCGVHASESSRGPTGRLPRQLAQPGSSGGPTVVELWLERFTASYPAKKSR